MQTMIEKELPRKLKKSLGKDKAESLYAHYVEAYSYLKENIFPDIPKKIPEFTSHDEKHIVDVLDNISKLLGDDLIKEIKCKDLYFLCLSAVFHDAGLIFGRDNHQNNIAEIYDTIRGKQMLTKFANEKSILINIVSAHTGKSRNDKTYDTLKDLGIMNAYNDSINVREIAAILRFADELAEGNQRTSDFIIDKRLIKKKANIYHLYSQSYSSVICFDRIAITYNFFLNMKDKKLFINDIALEEFLFFIYKRINKLDEERKYCRYYCQKWLSHIKEISIDFKFWIDSIEIKHNLVPIVLDDKIIPGDSKSLVTDNYPSYKYTSILSMLKKQIAKRKK